MTPIQAQERDRRSSRNAQRQYFLASLRHRDAAAMYALTGEFRLMRRETEGRGRGARRSAGGGEVMPADGLE